MEIEQFASIAIFLVIYVLIISTKIHRAVAALAGALAMIMAGTFFGFMDSEQAMNAIEMNTILLLLGMMMITIMIQESGFFEVVAKKLVKSSKGSPRLLTMMLTLINALMSAFIDDTTTVLMTIPIVIEVSKKLKINPLPLIIATALGANFGGTLTLIGDPPNILIGSAAKLSFLDFIKEIAPFSVVAVIFGILFIYLRIGRKITGKRSSDYKYEYEVKDKRLLIQGLFALSITIILFFFHEMIGVPASFAAMLGATLLLLLSLKNPRDILEKVEWPTLIFIASLFVLVEGLNRSGVIELLASGILSLTKDNLLMILLLLLWFSAIFSSLMDAVPYTAAAIPVVIKLSNSLQISGFSPLWIAVSIGAGIGGCLTPVGRIPIVIALGIAESHGYPISFYRWIKNVAPIIVSILAIISVIFVVFFH